MPYEREVYQQKAKEYSKELGLEKLVYSGKKVEPFQEELEFFDQFEETGVMGGFLKRYKSLKGAVKKRGWNFDQ